MYSNEFNNNQNAADCSDSFSKDQLLPQQPPLKVGEYELSLDSSFFLKKLLVSYTDIYSDFDEQIHNLSDNIKKIFSTFNENERLKNTLEVFTRNCSECVGTFHAYREWKKSYSPNKATGCDNRSSIEEGFICWDIMSHKLSVVLDLARDILLSPDIESKLSLCNSEEYAEDSDFNDLIDETKEIVDDLAEDSFCYISTLDTFKLQDFNNIFIYEDFPIEVTYPDSKLYYNIPTCVVNCILAKVFSTVSTFTDHIGSNFFSKLTLSKFAEILRSNDFNSTVLGSVLNGEANIFQMPNFGVLDDGTIKYSFNIPAVFCFSIKNNLSKIKNKLSSCAKLLNDLGGYLDVSLSQNEIDKLEVSIFLPLAKDSSDLFVPLTEDFLDDYLDCDINEADDSLEIEYKFLDTAVLLKLLENVQSTNTMNLSFDINELKNKDSRNALSRDLRKIYSLFPNNILNSIYLIPKTEFTDSEVVLKYDKFLNTNNDDLLGTYLCLPRFLIDDADILNSIYDLSLYARIKSLTFSYSSFDNAKDEILTQIDYLFSAIEECRNIVPKGSLYLSLEKKIDTSFMLKIFDSSNHLILKGKSADGNIPFLGRSLSPALKEEVLSLFKNIFINESSDNFSNFSDPLFSKSFFSFLDKKGIQVSDSLKLDWLKKIVEFKNSAESNSSLKSLFRYIYSNISKNMDIQITKEGISYFLDLIPGGREVGIKEVGSK